MHRHCKSWNSRANYRDLLFSVSSCSLGDIRFSSSWSAKLQPATLKLKRKLQIFRSENKSAFSRLTGSWKKVTRWLGTSSPTQSPGCMQTLSVSKATAYSDLHYEPHKLQPKAIDQSCLTGLPAAQSSDQLIDYRKTGTVIKCLLQCSNS